MFEGMVLGSDLIRLDQALALSLLRRLFANFRIERVQLGIGNPGTTPTR